MTLAINAVYHGFKVLQAQFVDEISSQAYIMEHIKSGARLLYLANDDDNKVFLFPSELRLQMIQVWHIFWSIPLSAAPANIP